MVDFFDPREEQRLMMAERTAKRDAARKKEDRAHRLKVAADEAGENRLLALESDLLDLRDEILLD